MNKIFNFDDIKNNNTINNNINEMKKTQIKSYIPTKPPKPQIINKPHTSPKTHTHIKSQDMSLQQMNNNTMAQKLHAPPILFNPIIGFNNDMKDIPVQFIIESYQQLKSKWNMVNDMNIMTQQSDIEANIKLMFHFIEDINHIDFDNVKQNYIECQKQIARLLKTIHEIPQDKLKRGFVAEIEINVPKMMKICECAYEQLLNVLKIQEYITPNSNLPANWKNILKQEFDPNKLNDKQKLLLRLYKSLSVDKYRKLNDECWEEIRTDEGYLTQTFQKTCDIKEYIIGKCKRFLDPENWKIVTSGNNKHIISDLEHMLIQLDDIDFPEVKLDRHKFSFNNGIYIIKDIECQYAEDGLTKTIYKSTFYHYTDPAIHLLDTEISSAKYIKEDFIEYDESMYWYNIPTPHLHSILEYQFNERKDCEGIYKTIYALIGRMLYNRGDLENWELITFIQGMAGAGKSTITKFVLKQFYNIEQIAELDNKIEKQFGLSPLALKNPFITIGDELDQNCQLDLTHFLKMISGETITAAVKGTKPLYLEWPSHLWFSGNQLPPWEDKGGALSRRMVPIFFRKMVRSVDKDMDLGLKIQKEIPNILQKCVKAYLEMVNEHSHEEFWHFCPDYFKETRNELQKISNIIRRFMESDEVVFDKSGVTLERDFFERLSVYAANNGEKLSKASRRNKNFSINSIVQQINDLYEDANITYEKKTVVVKGKRYDKVMVIFGIWLKQTDDINGEELCAEDVQDCTKDDKGLYHNRRDETVTNDELDENTSKIVDIEYAKPGDAK